MTDALYLGDADRVRAASLGSAFTLDGDEGRHAATVKRTRPGETVLVSDGEGTGVRVQGLAKGDRGELSVELLTEVGVHQLVAWQSRRSIVKWDAKAGKALAKWQSTAREAAKQSRRLRVPVVHPEVITPRTLIAHLTEVGGLVLVAHEEATTPLSKVDLPESGPVTVLIGPEGGISPEEVAELEAIGARTVLISDGVLRASTAGAVALVQLKMLEERRG